MPLPICPEAELHALGTLTAHSEMLPDAKIVVSPESFLVDRHRVWAEVLWELPEDQLPVDLATVITLLRQHPDAKKHKPDQKTWTEWIANYAQPYLMRAYLPHNLRTIADAHALRSLTFCLQEHIREAESVAITNAGALEEFVDIIENDIREHFTRNTRKARATPLQNSVRAAHERLLDPEARERPVETGISDIDHCLNGLRRGELIILAGSPGKGKTALGFQISLNAARRGKNSMFVSLEMSEEMLGDRALANLGDIPSTSIRHRQLTPQEREWAYDAVELADEMKGQVMLVDAPSCTMAEVRAQAQRMMRTCAIDLIVVDYLQLMRHHKKTNSRYDEVSEISRSLKSTALEYNVPIIALSQLSRAGSDGEPKLSHLRESGQLEQDADVVMMLWSDHDDTKLTIAKNRQGPTAVVKIGFVADKFRMGGFTEG